GGLTSASGPLTATMGDFEQRIEELYAHEAKQFGEEYFRAFNELKAGLNEGRIRAAEPDPNSPTGWKVNAWVKKGILLGFRIGRIVEMTVAQVSLPAGTSSRRENGAARIDFQFRDKHTYPLKKIPPDQNIRVVPGGSSIRDGCYIGKGVV